MQILPQFSANMFSVNVFLQTSFLNRSFSSSPSSAAKPFLPLHRYKCKTIHIKEEGKNTLFLGPSPKSLSNWGVQKVRKFHLGKVSPKRAENGVYVSDKVKMDQKGHKIYNRAKQI